jgi:hypothetical protein
MRISFDFDGTLADDFDGTFNDQKDKVIAKLQDLKRQSHEIFIVTKRYSPDNSGKGSINEHIDPLRLAAELGISGKNVFFTNRELKAATLQSLSIDMHFENSDVELDHFLRNFKSTSMNWVMVNRQPWQVFNAAAEVEEMEY